MIAVWLTAASAFTVASQIQPAPVPSVIVAPAAPVPGALVLRAGTPILMQTVVGLSSLTNREGDRFDLSVTEDVTVGGYTIIGRGARGIGEIAKLVPKGSFGKSGKLELRLLFVEAGDARIRLDGRAASRGRSGTAGTVVTAVLAGTFAAFVTGSSAVVPAGSAMTGFVDRDLPIFLQPVPVTAR
jgi:hypothetical protein